MEIDGNCRVALCRHYFRVPASGPAVAKTALRSAVDEKRHRQLAGRALGLDDLPPYLLSVGTDKVEPLDVDLVDLGEFGAIDIRQLCDRAVCRTAIQVGGRLQAVHGVNQRAVLQRNGRADIAARCQARDFARFDFNRECGVIEHFLSGNDEMFVVRRPDDRSDRAVPVLGQGYSFVLITALFAKFYDQAIGFITWPLHRCPGQPFAVR